MDLLDLLKRPEGKTLEFKRDLSSPDGVLRSLVAFANTSGGVVLLGVEDRTRHVRGVKEPLDLEERLANLISDHIVPRLVPELEIVPWRRRRPLAGHVLVRWAHVGSSAHRQRRGPVPVGLVDRLPTRFDIESTPCTR